MIARPRGELDLSTAGEFKLSIDRELDARKIVRLLIDLSEVSFMDSSGLGAILGRYRKLSLLGGKLFLIAPHGAVKSMLELSGIDRIVPVYDSEEECLRQIQRN
ncbi:MAG TPA: anti-sigma factor antagonist [Firmicutes bacterium]|nr:anti-sigma factor antagonist [Bacillota bacterium]